ncbi:hypothetical protein [Kluyvera sichuanensis]|uniref:hypothetical protein n=1 Tax=Kluyvera sichuanensis TaxID=2725494 RepID=UPI003F673FD2
MKTSIINGSEVSRFSVAIQPMFLLCVRSDGFKSKTVEFFKLRWILCLLILVSCITFFWRDSVALYISLPLSIIVSAFIMSVTKLNSSTRVGVVKDSDSGDLYLVRSGIARRMSNIESINFKSKVSDVDIPVINVNHIGEFPNVGYKMDDMIVNPSSGLPMMNGFGGIDVGGNTWGNENTQSGISINPTSGLPMDSIGTDIDVGGNSWGTTSSDFSNGHSSYDPNRGY